MQDIYVLNFRLVLHLMRVLVKRYNDETGVSVMLFCLFICIMYTVFELIITLVEFEIQCYCYVCDSAAPCKYWTLSSDKSDSPPHCDANSDWEEERSEYKRLTEEEAH